MVLHTSGVQSEFNVVQDGVTLRGEPEHPGDLVAYSVGELGG